MGNSYNTNLASEYLILSMLNRLGLDAYITLGNKKSIDIIVKNKTRTVTIDVKGLSGTTLFPLDNFKERSKNHFIVFVSYLNKITDCTVNPEIYIVPSLKIENLMYRNPKGNRQGVNLSRLRQESSCRDNWKVLF
jgi:hypothetical protein